MTETAVKIALPKGKLLNETASLFEKAGWGIEDYTQNTRYYRLKSRLFPDLQIKVFQEKDIPIQVSIGNYDLGICGLDWTTELLSKYPNSAVTKIRDLGYGKTPLFVASRIASEISILKHSEDTPVRIASEYPNLAEAYALNSRLKRFNIFPIWGGAEVYPPENAELALLLCDVEALTSYGLTAINKMLDSSAYLIANSKSYKNKDMDGILLSISKGIEIQTQHAQVKTINNDRFKTIPETVKETFRIALPDGHQQQPAKELLTSAGVILKDYPSKSGNRRPIIQVPGISDCAVKVIRPQDMPLQVANGNFDVAITGKDWVKDHLTKFPSSPVSELLDLGFGWVKIVAVVSGNASITGLIDLRKYAANLAKPFRIASEYVNIADKYARENHLGLYRIIPTWGATEAFLPDDADLLIENTQTGKTLESHNLKIFDTLFESTACLITSKKLLKSDKRKKIDIIVSHLRNALEDDN